MTADPTAGDPSGIRRIARLHTQHSDAVRAGSRHIVSAAEAASTGWAGKAQQQFVAKAATVPASAQRIAARLDAAATALDAYAREVEQIQDEAQRLRTAQKNAADDAAENARAIHDATLTVQSSDAVESDTVRLQQLENGAAGLAGLAGRLSAQWDELVTRRAAADRRAASALENPSVVGKLVSARTVAAMSDGQFLTWLGTLEKESIAALKNDPRIANRLAGMDAKDVASWWRGLSGEAKDALIAALPAVIGNLNGVSYADRGKANSNMVAHELHANEQRYAKLVGIVSRGGQLTVAQQAELSSLTERMSALKAIRTTMGDSTAEQPYTIISLTLGHPPLAAIAVGDMDSATRVTTTVPGMGTTVAGGIRSWTGAAANLQAAERAAAHLVDIDSNVATVAWVGYDTPDMPPSLEVMSSAKAKAGAARLDAFMDGVSATRGWQPGDHLSLVGHSYGTTTATLAAAKTPVENLTLLASAGVDTSVPNVSAVHVPAGHTWASQAKDDYIANIGRGVAELPGPLDGGSQPGLLSGNRSYGIALPSEHPLNPGGSIWGARTFSSNDQTVDGVPYHGSDGHGATPATEAIEKGQPVGDYGYLDRETSSLRSTAYTSLGYTPDGKLIP
ncbi:alpha/beta hydrolase [Curtobacterium sp. ISL-83]|uniref:alpha/beta hydrolase n=1 Tax=Curtobacterium sp. ISL-83 TaxID=2819145 RepID=UPI001BEAC62E|nr:alpha/beta hydrolase [Curtobacterium sp. ISL-83]MBT2503125.1 hypothetical protein [Curtobacterium sp. ISL-83]